MFGRTNSVIRRNAKFNTHLQPDPAGNDPSPALSQKLVDIKNIIGPWYIVFTLMMVGGCRINEILKASHSQISNEGGLLIVGAKGSNNRYVFASETSSYLLKMKASSTDPFKHLNVFAAIRVMKKYGIVKMKKGRTNLTVTGVFRDLKAMNVRDVSNDESLTASVLGHKNIKSTSYYGKH